MRPKNPWAAGIGIALLLMTAVVPSFAYAASANAGQQPPATPTPYVILQSKAAGPACSNFGLCPIDVTTAYDFNALFSDGVNGTGQTVVIVDACGSPTIKSDLKAFDSAFGLNNPTLKVVDVQGSPCTDSGWALETSLDVEWAHVMAPGAAIDLLVGASPSFTDLYGAWTYSLKHGLGNQISNSWGGGASCGAASLLRKAMSQNVTVLTSSGDGGAWGQGTSGTAQEPADCQYILTVGGTQLNITGSGNYAGESAWSDAGGGYVPGAKEPSYQKSVGISDSFMLLGKSDVSADASCGSPVLVYDTGYGGWVDVCGTSVSTPMWAGFMADVNQIRAVYGFAPAGFINEFLYLTVYGVNGGSSIYHTDFHDVTTGNDGWPAGTGWDVPTGLGSFDGLNLGNTLGTNIAA